jgi:hypothetical protein
MRGFAQTLSFRAGPFCLCEVDPVRQHKAANFRHRAELLYLESWKGKRLHAANLPRSGI